MELSKDLKGVTKEDMKRVTIAYEPVWAIGTGLTCDPDTAQVCVLCSLLPTSQVCVLSAA
jgi:triosephosphate isomerase